jgi:2-phosphosulfolactate phosphatase
MDIKILNLLQGAKNAQGLTVIIDVFRAFSVECYLYQKGVKNIYAVGTIEKAIQLKNEHPEYILVGERDGLLLDGFHYGNSPYFINKANNIKGNTVVHTTSAGTQGIVNAKNATEIITGSFVNAKAIAKYILSKQPEKVSIVAMGVGGLYEAREDVLCANYIKSLLLNEKYDLSNLQDSLFNNGGEKFRGVDTQDSQPKEDFYLCLDCDRFDFVIKAMKIDEDMYEMMQIDTKML